MNMWLDVTFAIGLIVRRRFQLLSDSCFESARADLTTSSALALILSRAEFIRYPLPRKKNAVPIMANEKKTRSAVARKLRKYMLFIRAGPFYFTTSNL